MFWNGDVWFLIEMSPKYYIVWTLDLSINRSLTGITNGLIRVFRIKMESTETKLVWYSVRMSMYVYFFNSVLSCPVVC